MKDRNVPIRFAAVSGGSFVSTIHGHNGHGGVANYVPEGHHHEHIRRRPGNRGSGFLTLLCLFAICLLGYANAGAVELLNFTNNWHFNQSGTNQGTAWRLVQFDDSAWPQGPGAFGYYTNQTYPPSVPQINTPLTPGGGRTTYYFRTHFNFPTNMVGFELVASNYVEDGAVFYLNGTEVGRARMPDGVVNYQTPATSDDPTGLVQVLTFSSGSLVQGDNVLAVELHQTTPTNSEVLFGMHLRAIVESNLTTKILVDNTDTNTTSQLGSRGAANLANYNSFSLWSVTADQAAGLLTSPGVTIRYDFDAIPIRGGLQISTQTGEPGIPVNLQQIKTTDPQFWMVQFAGPIKDAWLAEATNTGVRIVSYTPANAYIVWGTGQDITNLEALASQRSYILGTHPYHPYYRLEASLQQLAMSAPSNQEVNASVQIFDSTNLNQSLSRLEALGGTVWLQPASVDGLTSISLQLPAGQLINVASWADCYNVEPWSAPILLDEVQDHILAGNVKTVGSKIIPLATSDLTYLTYRNWLLTKGFPTTQTSYPIVDVVDDGVDQGDASDVLHPDFYEFGNSANPVRIAYIANCTASPSGHGVGGHGNLNAGIVGAYNNTSGSPYVDGNGYHIGIGVSPFGRVAGTKIFDDTGSFDLSGVGGTYQGLVGSCYTHGANLTSDSWGAAAAGAYNTTARDYDSLTRDASTTTAGEQPMLHIFAAANQGAYGAMTIGSPGSAKNVLTVGATENVRDDGVSDGCGLSASDNADDVATYSSRGPCADGRTKPDIMAPGSHIQGPASQDPGFNGTSVCGATTSHYYPTGGQTLYTWSSGTSHATPAIAGAASLAYENYENVLDPGHTPSPAMLKALLINSTRYLTGYLADDTLPSDNQGWGDANLGRAFDGTPRLLVDQSTVFADSGEDYSVNPIVYDATKPVRVTLVWSDAPGNTTGDAWVNDLDLEVTVGGVTYKGNHFSGQYSISGGSADTKNNVESVFLPAGTAGSFTVRVVASNIAGDGVPGNADTSDQDFALVIYNAYQPTAPAADAFIADDPLLDDGTEPDPASINMWESQDIWIRTTYPDTTPGHQNPEYGQINTVNVHLRNYGPNVGTPLTVSGVVKLYWANGSSALTWPTYWNWFADIPATLPAGADVYVSAPWYPPGVGHFCITAVWVSDNDPLHSPLVGNPNVNTRNNNNIAWRNLNVVNLLPDRLSLVSFLMRNPLTNVMYFDIRLRARLTDKLPFPDTFLDNGQVYFDLGSTLYQRWLQSGAQGTGFQVVTNQGGSNFVFQLLDPQGAYIRNVLFYGGEEFKATMSFNSSITNTRKFVVDMAQMIDSNTPLGGMTYELHTGPVLDTDGDGIPDWWMNLYFGHPTGQAADSSRATDDADGDGMNTRQEYLAGTDPTDPASYFRIDTINSSGGTNVVQMQFYAASNRTYSVLYTGDLKTGVWQVLTNVPAMPSGQEITVWDSDLTNGVPLRFYKLATPHLPLY